MEDAEESVEEALTRLEGLIASWENVGQSLGAQLQTLSQQVADLSSKVESPALAERLVAMEQELKDLKTAQSPTPPEETPRAEKDNPPDQGEADQEGHTSPESPRYKFL